MATHFHDISGLKVLTFVVTFISLVQSSFAQALCGNATGNSTECPLNVCCSKFGFCGTTAEFCGGGCQSNCAPVAKPSCSESKMSAAGRRIGYYEAWSSNRTCDRFTPDLIPAEQYTHLNYAFATLSNTSYLIEMPDANETRLYTQLTDLKQRDPALKVYLSIGGFNVPGEVFSGLAASKQNRSAFVNSTLAVVKKFGFDGVDIDWEYPAAADRNGTQADYVNIVHLMKELKEAFCGCESGIVRGVTMTVPAGYYYLKGFDLKKLQQHVDWFNVLSYDLHGPWEATKQILPHTNLTEIDDALDLFWRNKINPEKVVMGLAYYGRSYALADSSCTKPGCNFTGTGVAGKCVQIAGILSDAEIQRVIQQFGVTPTFDRDAAVKYISYGGSQWADYDDGDTFALKTTFANKRCLGGTLAWAVDMAPMANTSAAMNISALTGPVPPVMSNSSMASNSSRTASNSTSTSVSMSTSNTTMSATAIASESGTASGGSAAPGPTATGTTSSCTKYAQIKSGDTCSSIAQTAGVTLAQFLGWNKSLNDQCTNLLADFYYCVAGPA